MGVFGAADLDALLADMGVSVTYSGTTVKGLLDNADTVDTDGSGMQVPTGRQVCRIKTGALTIPIDATVVVDGTNYVVQDTQLEGDGAYTRLILA